MDSGQDLSFREIRDDSWTNYQRQYSNAHAPANSREFPNSRHPSLKPRDSRITSNDTRDLVQLLSPTQLPKGRKTPEQEFAQTSLERNPTKSKSFVSRRLIKRNSQQLDPNTIEERRKYLNLQNRVSQKVSSNGVRYLEIVTGDVPYDQQGSFSAGPTARASVDLLQRDYSSNHRLPNLVEEPRSRGSNKNLDLPIQSNVDRTSSVYSQGFAESPSGAENRDSYMGSMDQLYAESEPLSGRVSPQASSAQDFGFQRAQPTQRKEITDAAFDSKRRATPLDLSNLGIEDGPDFGESPKQSARLSGGAIDARAALSSNPVSSPPGIAPTPIRPLPAAPQEETRGRTGYDAHQQAVNAAVAVAADHQQQELIASPKKEGKASHWPKREVLQQKRGVGPQPSPRTSLPLRDRDAPAEESYPVAQQIKSAHSSSKPSSDESHSQPVPAAETHASSPDKSSGSSPTIIPSKSSQPSSNRSSTISERRERLRVRKLKDLHKTKASIDEVVGGPKSTNHSQNAGSQDTTKSLTRTDGSTEEPAQPGVSETTNDRGQSIPQDIMKYMPTRDYTKQEKHRSVQEQSQSLAKVTRPKYEYRASSDPNLHSSSNASLPLRVSTRDMNFTLNGYRLDSKASSSRNSKYMSASDQILETPTPDSDTEPHAAFHSVNGYFPSTSKHTENTQDSPTPTTRSKRSQHSDRTGQRASYQQPGSGAQALSSVPANSNDELKRLRARNNHLERQNKLLEAALYAVLHTAGELNNRCPCGTTGRPASNGSGIDQATGNNANLGVPGPRDPSLAPSNAPQRASNVSVATNATGATGGWGSSNASVESGNPAHTALDMYMATRAGPIRAAENVNANIA